VPPYYPDIPVFRQAVARYSSLISAQIAFDAIRAGARFVATNPDRYCPVPSGGEPDCAAMIAAIEACSATRVEVIVGKPSPIMIDLPPARCIMVGDRLATDIAMGKAAGMATALPLTGETTSAMLETAEIKPDYVLKSLHELVE